MVLRLIMTLGWEISTSLVSRKVKNCIHSFNVQYLTSAFFHLINYVSAMLVSAWFLHLHSSHMTFNIGHSILFITATKYKIFSVTFDTTAYVCNINFAKLFRGGGCEQVLSAPSFNSIWNLLPAPRCTA